MALLGGIRLGMRVLHYAREYDGGSVALASYCYRARGDLSMENQQADSTDRPHTPPTEPISKDKPNDAVEQPSTDKDAEKAEREQERQLESGEENPT